MLAAARDRKRSVERKYAIGLDYGTNSVRAIVADLDDGSVVASAVHDYASGDAGILLDRKDPHVARQNPQDYVEGCIQAVGAAVRSARRKHGFQPERVVGIGVDSTGSTPLPVDAQGRPLASKR